MDWRRKFALWLCPDLALAATPAVSPALPLEADTASKAGVYVEYEHLFALVERYADHVGRSEATISNKAVGHARLFERLRAGHGCTVKTAQSTIVWFDAHWPADLAWPPSIPRPSDKKDAL